MLNNAKALFPDAPSEWVPELGWLKFYDGNPDDYQYAVEVPAEQFPMYVAAPLMLATLKRVEQAALRPGSELHNAVKAAIAAAEGRP